MATGEAFRLVQPWSADRGRKVTALSGHATAADTFKALDALAEPMVQTGVRGDAIELLAVDAAGNPVARPGVH